MSQLVETFYKSHLNVRAGVEFVTRKMFKHLMGFFLIDDIMKQETDRYFQLKGEAFSR